MRLPPAFDEYLLREAAHGGGERVVWERLFPRRNFRRVEECRRLIAWLDARRGERILDVGCGHGYNDRTIARSGAHVVGIDLDAERLAVARKRNRTPRTEFRLMNAERMQFPDASFDKAVSFCVIEHFRDDAAVLAHLNRVLRPGARLVVSADSLSNPEITESERAWHRRRYAVNEFYTRESLAGKLERAGFRVERSRYILTARFTLALVRLSWRLDALPRPMLPVKIAGYALLGTVGTLVSAVVEPFWGRPGSGLTLLMQARKPIGPE